VIDTLACSEAKLLAADELGDFQFLVAIIIWYEILSVVNLVNKQLQSKDVLIDIQYMGLFPFSKTLEAAKELAMEMDRSRVPYQA